VYEKPFCRGMGILPMRRRAILALQLAFSPRADCLVKRTARMAVPLLIRVLSSIVVQQAPGNARGGLRVRYFNTILRHLQQPCFVVHQTL